MVLLLLEGATWVMGTWVSLVFKAAHSVFATAFLVFRNRLVF